MEQYASREKMMVFTPIDPKIRNCLNVLYSRTRETQEREINKKIHDTSLRRCNKCGKYHLIQNTVLRKYYPHSKRKYRLCVECEEKYITAN